MTDRKSMQILPDSTGRAVLLHHHFKVVYSNLQPGKAFLSGDVVVGGTSATQFSISYDEVNLTPSVLYGTLTAAHSESNFTPGEQLLVDGVHIADAVDAGVCVFVNPIQNVSYDNPFYGQIIDSQGSANVRFAEGSQQFDGVGRSLYSEYTAIAEYSFRYSVTGGGNEGMYVTSSGTASIVHEPGTSSAIALTGTGISDYVSGTSKVRHLYSYGNSLIGYFVMAMGDPGKTNVRRRWGFFDQDDGFFFEVEGTQLYVVYRSSFNGAISDTRIAQQDWSKDVLDGSKTDNNRSGIALDISTVNGYWIDINHGIRCRFGILSPTGGRIVVHEHSSANTSFRPATKTPSLPIRAEQQNLGAPGSSSEWRVFYIGVGIEGFFNPDRMDASGLVAVTLPARVSVAAEEIPLLSIRPKQTVAGTINHVKVFPRGLNLATTGTVGEQFIVRIREDSTLSGASWESAGPYSSVEKDVTASGISVPGAILFEGYSSVGITTQDLKEYFLLGGKHMHLLPDNVTQMVYTVTAQAVDSVPGTIDTSASLRWYEV